MSLIAVIYKQMLTKSEHAQLCHSNTAEVKKFFVEETVKIKEHFDLKIENVVMKELRKINNGGKS